jgi:hypothetical protein
MLRLRPRRNALGFTVVEVLAVSAIMSGLSSQGNYRYALTKANELKGVNNLRQVYMLLLAQSIGGGLPKAAFYPKGDPKKDPKSIVRLIHGAPPELFVSPFAPAGLKRKGLTFAWNDKVNGKDMSLLPKDTWLLIDLAAFIVDPDVPKPQRYLVLYADGRALAVKELPPDIVKAVEKARAAAAESEKAKQRAG